MIKLANRHITYPEFPSGISGALGILSTTTFRLNALSGTCSYITKALDDHLINRAYFSQGVVNAGSAIFLRIETVTSQGLPSGFLVNPGASAQLFTVANSGIEVSFPGSFNISRGTIFAFVFAASSGGPIPDMRINLFTDDNADHGFPYALNGISLAQTASPLIGLGTVGNSGVPIKHAWPLSSVAIETYNSSSTANIRGNKITLNYKARITGIRAFIDLDANARAVLYGTDGSTVLTTTAILSNIPPDTAGYPTDIYFDTPVTVNPGTYYAAISATLTTPNITISTLNYPSSADGHWPYWRTASPFGGGDVIYTSSGSNPSSSSSWTDVHNRHALVSLLIDGFDDGFAETSSVFMY
jgi:hypothetical protein